MHFTLLGLLFLGFWLYCILDVAMADPSLVRNLPKIVWLVLVVVVPTVGGVAWLIAGRPSEATARPGSTDRRRPRPPIARPDRSSGAPRQRPPRQAPPRRSAPRGPDDDPDFLRRLDEELRRGDDA